MKPRLVMLMAVALAGGCHRSQKAPAKVITITGESTVLPRAPSGRAAAVHATPRKLQVRAKPRDYLLIAPTVPSAGPRPLVLVLHGDGGGMTSFHRSWPFEDATQNDAYLAYLDGLNSTWDLETLKDNRDVAFAEAVINELATELPIDRTHVFAAGYSSGGFFANLIACHKPGLLRAIASNAGGAPFNQADKWANGYPKCPDEKPTAALSLHGEQDFTVTLDSGRFDAQYWAYVNGCNESEMETTGYSECRVYRGCPTGKAVGFCAIGPLGHWVWSESAAASWTFFMHQ